MAAAGTCGLAVYSRRARRWRLFGDAMQERGIRVQSLMWLPGGVIAVAAHVAASAGAPAAASGASQLLLYPHDHLDAASVLARLPLQQVRCRAWLGWAAACNLLGMEGRVLLLAQAGCQASVTSMHAPPASTLPQTPVAMDSSGWHLALAFAPLEIKLLRVTLETAAGRPAARLSVVRELSILGLGNPVQASSRGEVRG